MFECRAETQKRFLTPFPRQQLDGYNSDLYLGRLTSPIPSTDHITFYLDGAGTLIAWRRRAAAKRQGPMRERPSPERS